LRLYETFVTIAESSGDGGQERERAWHGHPRVPVL